MCEKQDILEMLFFCLFNMKEVIYG